MASTDLSAVSVQGLTRFERLTSHEVEGLPIVTRYYLRNCAQWSFEKESSCWLRVQPGVDTSRSHHTTR